MYLNQPGTSVLCPVRFVPVERKAVPSRGPLLMRPCKFNRCDFLSLSRYVEVFSP